MIITWANNWNGVGHRYEPPAAADDAAYRRGYEIGIKRRAAAEKAERIHRIFRNPVGWETAR